MKKSTKILSLSAAALLIIIFIVFIISRRGRKVYLADKYRLNNAYYINVYPEDDWDNYIFYNGTLDYVIVPYKARTISSDGSEYIQVSGIGELGSDGNVRRMKLKGNMFVDTRYLNL